MRALKVPLNGNRPSDAINVAWLAGVWAVPNGDKMTRGHFDQESSSGDVARR